jgi:outer membrane receptor protein involved in Fe transport
MKFRLILSIMLLSATTLVAQTFRGSIQGVVTDTTGASVPGAQVTALNSGTGLSRSTTTDDAGNYVFTELPIGSYDVTASKSGFNTPTLKGVRVEVAGVTRGDIQLTPGSVETRVDVTAEIPLVQTTSNTQGGIIATRELATLPTNGRDFIKFLGLVPGVTADPSAVTDFPGSFGLFSINGNRGRSNNYLLDGTDMNDGYRNLPSINEAGVFGTPATLLPVEALAEIAVLNATEAEYGRNSGAIINTVTKSGTNDLHGSVFYFGRTSSLDARNYFNQEPSPQSLFRNDQFGGSVGGPIIKDKTFWFLAYEGQRERVGIPTPSVIPSMDQINCFLLNGGAIHPIIQNILDLGPWTQGGPLPASGDGGAASLADLCATNPATPLTVTLDASGTNDLHSLIFKMDHNFNAGRDIITGRYFYGHSDQNFPLGLVGGSAVPGYNTVTPTTVHVLSLSYTHSFSEKLLVELRGGYNRFFETFFPEDSDLDPRTLGLNSVSNPQDFGLTFMRFGDATSSIGANSSVPRGRVDTNSQIFGNVAYSTGKHNWKFGYEFRRTFVNGFFDAGFRGTLTFCDFNEFLQGMNNCGGNNQRVGNSDRDTFQNNHGLYVQDNWKVTPRLTLNLGLRWDYYGVIGEEQGLFSLFNNDVVNPAVIPTSQLYPKDYNNFGPRVSFAYDLTGKGNTVLRGGWGLYYDAFSQDFFVGQLPWPTFNSGPAYNFAGPFPVSLSYFVNNPGNGGPGELGLYTPAVLGTCDSTADIVVPNSGGQCAAPTFIFDPAFGNDTFTVDQELATPYIQNYNLNVQHQFGRYAAVQVGYVGSAGRRLFRYRDINQAGSLIGFPAAFGFGYLLQFESRASSNYNSLQTSLQLRNWRGLSSKFNYVWAHSIDDASDGLDDVPNTAQPNDSFNPRGERANSNFDTRHRVTWYFTYEFPKAERAKWLLDGWSVDGIFSYSSGQPFTVSYIADFCCDFDGLGEFFGRPDLVGNPFSGTTEPHNFLNLSAFAVPCDYDGAFGCTGNQHPGTSPRNAFMGPAFHNFDFAVSKVVALGDRARLQFRIDAFNLFNHPNFSSPYLPNFFVDFTTNGLDATGRGIGFLPITATPDVGIGNPFLGGGGPRNIQLGVRLTF